MEIFFAIVAVAVCAMLDKEYNHRSQMRFIKKHGLPPDPIKRPPSQSFDIPKPRYKTHD